MADTPTAALPDRPSFFSSVASGISGYIKGAIAGVTIGAVGGALGGAVIGAIAFATTGSAFAILANAGWGALIGGSALASIGAVAGTITGVVKSREVGQPSAEDVVNVAKLSFAQGVAVGHNIEHAMQGQGTKHRDLITKERAQLAMAEQQVIN